MLRAYVGDDILRRRLKDGKGQSAGSKEEVLTLQTSLRSPAEVAEARVERDRKLMEEYLLFSPLTVAFAAEEEEEEEALDARREEKKRVTFGEEHASSATAEGEARKDARPDDLSAKPTRIQVASSQEIPENWNIFVYNHSSSSFDFEVASSGSDHLEVSPSRGRLSPKSALPVIVTPAPDAFNRERNWQGRIVITSGGVEIPVEIEVEGRASRQPQARRSLILSTRKIEFTASEVGRPEVKSVTLKNTGRDKVYWMLIDRRANYQLGKPPSRKIFTRGN